MKKMVLFVIALMLIATVAFAEDITKGDLQGLKGTWAGILSFDVGSNCPAELVILNDTEPVKAQLKLSMVPDQIAQMLAAMGGRATLSSDDGKITTQGSLMFAGNKNFFEFFLKRNKLNGWFYYNGARGDLILHKK